LAFFQQPKTNSQEPRANSQRPTAKGQQPKTNSQRPTANSQRPTANSQKQRKMKHQILFIWKVEKNLQQHLTEELKDCNVDLIFPEKSDENFFLEMAPRIDVIVGWRASIELINKAVNLKLLINPGAGVYILKDRFALLKDKNIVLVNGHGNAYYTAQHIVAMLLSVCNKITPHHQWMLEGKWRLGDKEAKSLPLKSRKIGLLGYGHINKYVHQFLAPFQSEFHILRKKDSKELEYDYPSKVTSYTISSKEEFLQKVDVLIIAMPLTKATENFIDAKELKLLGENGIVINAGRGKIVNEEALYNALKNKDIDCAAIDVWYDYKPEPDEADRKFPYQHPFYELDNILLSPHRAASPMDSLDRWNDVIENIKRCADGKTEFLNVVDFEEGY